MPQDNPPPRAEQAAAPPSAGRGPGLVKRLYREEGEAWRGHYRKYFKYAARALGLGFVAGFLFFTFWPAQEKRALAFVIDALKDIPLEASPLLMALSLFYHNARASVVAVAAGLVPFVFLPILDPVLNGGVLGLLVSITKHQGLDVPRLVLTQILPHGVFELTAALYATGVGLHLSAAMGKRAKRAWLKKRKGTCTPGTCPPVTTDHQAAENFLETYGNSADAESPGLFRNIVRSFVLVVLPLLLVAAFVEGFITPLLD